MWCSILSGYSLVFSSYSHQFYKSEDYFNYPLINASNGPLSDGPDVVKLPVHVSMLALEIQAVRDKPDESDSPEHSMSCAMVYQIGTTPKEIEFLTSI